MWKEHFKNLLGKSPKVTDKPITKIINDLQDIKQGQFTQELNVVLTQIKNRKAAGLDEIPQEVCKTRKFDDLLLCFCNDVYNLNTIKRWTKGCIPLFSKKGDLRITKNYWDITFTSMAAKIYNALLLNHIEPEIKKILWKNQNGFCRNQSTTSQILTVCQILVVCEKKLEATLLFINSSKAFDSIHRGKIKQILLVFGLPKETITAIMMLYKNTEVKIHSPPGDADIVVGVLQRDTWATYLFIICLDYILQKLIALMKENGFTLKKVRSRWYCLPTPPLG